MVFAGGVYVPGAYAGPTNPGFTTPSQHGDTALYAIDGLVVKIETNPEPGAGDTRQSMVVVPDVPVVRIAIHASIICRLNG